MQLPVVLLARAFVKDPELLILDVTETLFTKTAF